MMTSPSIAKLAVTPPVVGSVRTERYGSRRSPRRSSAAEVLAICMSERIPSCIRAPPDAETMTTGRCLSMASSIARVSFSPTTDPMLPPRNPNSNTHSTAGRPPMRATPVTIASSDFVFSTAARSRSRYFLVSLKPSGSVDSRVRSRSSKVPGSARSAMRSRAETRKG
jgi:hypothetical protein